MPAPLTLARVFDTWTLDLPVLVMLLAVGGGYGLGVTRLRAAGTEWPRQRVAYFVGFVLTAVLATMSFLNRYGQVLFWPRAVETVILLMLTPLLLALSAPITLLLATCPPALAARLRAIGRSRLARTVTFPVAVTVTLVAPPFLIYLTPLYALSLRHAAVHELVRLFLVAAGFVYFWTRVRADPTPREDPHAVSLWISAIEVVGDGVLGLVIWLGPLLAPHYFAHMHAAWAPSQRFDQSIGAGVLWIGGDLLGLPFLGAMMTRWRREDDRRAAELDRALDVAEAQRQETGTTPQWQSGLWWENDPMLAERFRHR